MNTKSNIHEAVAYLPHDILLCRAFHVEFPDLSAFSASRSTYRFTVHNHHYVEVLHNDGVGEGMEQRERKTEYGDLYVHLWHSGKDYRVYTEQELKGQQIQRQRQKPKTKNHEKVR